MYSRRSGVLRQAQRSVAMKDKEKVKELFVQLKSQVTTDYELSIVEECEAKLVGAVLNLKTGEEWRDIKDYEGYYQVSNFGRVRSFHHRVPHILTPRVAFNYLKVPLCRGKNDEKVFFVHILVAKTFIPNPENKKIVNHKDGNKTNNHVENLEWVTQSENLKHAYQIGLVKPLRGTESPKSKLTEDDVRYIRKFYRAHDRKFGAIALAKKFGVSKYTIYNIITGKTYKNII